MAISLCPSPPLSHSDELRKESRQLKKDLLAIKQRKEDASKPVQDDPAEGRSTLSIARLKLTRVLLLSLFFVFLCKGVLLTGHVSAVGFNSLSPLGPSVFQSGNKSGFPQAFLLLFGTCPSSRREALGWWSVPHSPLMDVQADCLSGFDN